MRILLNIFAFYWSLVVHKIYVMYFLSKFCVLVIYRGLVHDLSKFTFKEARYFIPHFHGLKKSVFGTRTYDDLLKAVNLAVDHHYKNNRHHPEFHPGGINNMNLIDVVELFCDWRASTFKHSTGNIFRSVRINNSRFNITGPLYYILSNTAKVFNIKDEYKEYKEELQNRTFK